MIKLDKIPDNKLHRINSWLKNHNKSYLTDIADLKYQLDRYEKSVNISRVWATVITLAFDALVVIGEWFVPLQTPLDFTAVILLVAENIFIWTFLYYRLKWNESKQDREVFDSVRAFNKDWKDLMKRESPAGVIDDLELRQIGEQVADATRLEDEKRVQRLLKELKEEHKLLYKFGCTENADWGIHIPKKETVVIPVNWDDLKQPG